MMGIHRQLGLERALTDLDTLASRLGLSQDMKAAAAKLYRASHKTGFMRGKLTESVVASTVYLTCRKFGMAYTLREIADASGLAKRELGRVARILAKKMKIKTPLLLPEAYVPRICAGLGLSSQMEAKAIKMTNRLSSHFISGSHPNVIAGATIYIVSILGRGEEWTTQNEVAHATGATEITIRNQAHKIVKELRMKMPKTFCSLRTAARGHARKPSKLKPEVDENGYRVYRTRRDE